METLQEVAKRRIVTASVPPEVAAELHRRAKADDRTISWEIRRALVRYLAETAEVTADA